MKKMIKEPGKFSKVSCYIAAVLFALSAFLVTGLDLIQAFSYDYNPFDFDKVLFIASMIAAALLLVFKNVKLLPIPFAIYGIIQGYWLVSTVIDMFKYKSFGFNTIIYRFVNLAEGFGALLLIFIAIFALFKATRKITVVWFIPGIVFTLSVVTELIAEIVGLITNIANGWFEFTNIFGVLLGVAGSIIFTIGVYFAGLAIRAFAKQLLFEAQKEDSMKDEIIN
jgi:hypothetical protein